VQGGLTFGWGGLLEIRKRFTIPAAGGTRGWFGAPAPRAGQPLADHTYSSTFPRRNELFAVGTFGRPRCFDGGYFAKYEFRAAGSKRGPGSATGGGGEGTTVVFARRFRSYSTQWAKVEPTFKENGAMSVPTSSILPTAPFAGGDARP